MRNQTDRRFLSAWILAPLLGVACDPGDVTFQHDYFPWDPWAQLCGGFDKVLSTDSVGQLICKDLPPGATPLPDCKKHSQALTSDGKRMFCTNRNKEAQGTRVALDNLEQSELLIREYQTKILSLNGPPDPALRAVYCGQDTTATHGSITDGTASGIVAAASLCRKVPGCSQSAAKMCTVYDLYYSAATGKLPDTLSQSWVFMASWQHNNAAEVLTANGLADNCAGYTYGQDDKQWYGTTVEWKDAPSGHKALHFASGPGIVACSARFPIACCN